MPRTDLNETKAKQQGLSYNLISVRIDELLKNAFTWLYQRSRGTGSAFPRVEAAPDVFSGKGY